MKIKQYLLSEKEIDQMIIFERIKNKELTQEEAAQILQLSVRQVRRKLKKYLAYGKVSLAHAGRGKKSNRAFPVKQEEKIIEIIRQDYSNLPDPRPGPTFLSEELAKNHQISIDHEILRRIMIKNNLWTVSKKKQRKHVWRERKHHIGEMVQVDGSRHIWFGDSYCTLIAFIDDATGRVQVAKFVDYESVENLGLLTQQYTMILGRPLALYTDRHSTYKVNNGINRSDVTQFHRMLKELDIDLIHARSPQAKGRVERLFKTMQDRLVKQLFLAEIKTIEEANLFLQQYYLPEHNDRFSVIPLKKADYHRPSDAFNLNTIFCRKFKRILNNAYTVSFKGKLLQLDKKQPVMLRRGESIEIFESFDNTIRLFKKKMNLSFKIISPELINKKKCSKVKETPDDKKGRPYRKPSINHPWRIYNERYWEGNTLNRTFLKSSK